jgi:hypothetical protein
MGKNMEKHWISQDVHLQFEIDSQGDLQFPRLGNMHKDTLTSINNLAGLGAPSRILLTPEKMIKLWSFFHREHIFTYGNNMI